MVIKLPQEFISVVKDHQILLDTNIFIDVLINPIQFTNLLKELKENGCNLFTTELVAAEFIRGTVSIDKILQREKLIEDIIESYLPITNQTFENCLKLIKLYGEDSKSLSITDLLLGSFLVDNPKELLLITKNITDFPTNIFKLETFINLIYRKSIQTYGIYSYPK